jgi:putative transposase
MRTHRQQDKRQAALQTLWRIPDSAWALSAPILAKRDPPKPIGRLRIDPRRALDAMIFRLRSGCQWNHLPRECPDDSSVHRTMQRWVSRGVFPEVWAVLVRECDDLGGLHWDWQAVDGWLGKARLGGEKVGPNPTDRAKAGTKKAFTSTAKGGRWGWRSPARIAPTASSSRGRLTRSWSSDPAPRPPSRSGSA